MVDNSESGILVFSEKYIEKYWTKGDLLNYLNLYDKKEYIDTLQIWSGCFFLKKTCASKLLVDDWFSLHMDHYDLTTDKRSKVPNHKGFMEHRHDQSTFSLLVKRFSFICIKNNEVYPIDGSWQSMELCPILAKRNKQKPHPIILWKLSFPFRFLLGVYLILFEKMHYRFSWWY